MKILILILLSSLFLSPWAIGDELRFGEKKRLDRVSLLKVVITPEALDDREIQVSGYIHNVEGGLPRLFFTEEFKELNDIGNAVLLKGQKFYNFLHENADEIISTNSYHMIVQGIVRHDETIENIHAKTWIEVTACAIYVARDKDTFPNK